MSFLVSITWAARVITDSQWLLNDNFKACSWHISFRTNPK